MPILYVVLILLAIGFGLYFINTRAPRIDGKIKSIINWVVIIAVVVWLLKLAGVFNFLTSVRV